MFVQDLEEVEELIDDLKKANSEKECENALFSLFDSLGIECETFEEKGVLTMDKGLVLETGSTLTIKHREDWRK